MIYDTMIYMEGIQTYFVLVVIFLTWFFLLNQHRNSNKTLKLAARFLNTRTHWRLGGNFVEDFYKNRKIRFSTISNPHSPPGSPGLGWIFMFTSIVQISTEVNIQDKGRPQPLFKPTSNTYLKGRQVYYNLPSEHGKRWIGIESGFASLYKNEDLPAILDELVQAADIVEKQSHHSPETTAN